MPAPDAHQMKSWPGNTSSDDLLIRLVDRLLAAFVLFWAVWTLCCHLVVVQGGSFNTLLCMVPWACLILLAAAGWLFSGFPTLHGAPPVQANKIMPGWVVLAVLGTAVSLLALFFYIHPNPWLLWLSICLGTGAALLVPSHSLSPVAWFRPGKEALILLGLCAIGIAQTLIINRVNTDTAFYANVIVTALDYPDAPLLRNDWMHGVNQLPIHLPAYQAHSHELLSALLAWATNLPTLAVYHLLLPAFFASFLILACWRFLAWISRASATPATAAFLLMLLIWADRNTSPGNSAFVTLSMGKPLLAFIVVPLAYVYVAALRESINPRLVLLLFGLQIAAVGLSSTGLIVAPAAVSVAAIPLFRMSVGAAKRLAFAAASCAYPILVGVWIVVTAPVQPSELTASNAVDLVGSSLGLYGSSHGLLWHSIGETPRAGLWALLLIISLPLTVWRFGAARSGLIQVFCGALILANPWTGEFLAQHVSVNMAYRILWAWPFALFVALGLASLADLLAARENHVWIKWRLLPSLRWRLLMLLALLLAAVPGKLTPLPQNHVRFDWSGYRVDEWYAPAKTVCAAVPRGSSVLAPKKINLWLTTFREHPSVNVIKSYTITLRPFLGPTEYETRERLDRALSGLEGDTLNEPWLRETLRTRNYALVVELTDQLPPPMMLRTSLTALGYLREQRGAMLFWHSPQASSLPPGRCD